MLFYICFTIIFLFLHTFSACALSAKSAILIDADSGMVLFSHNANERLGMASTTKIMTALTALENGDISSTVKVSPTAYGVEGSSMYLVLGEELSLENLLYGLMLVSGNDAATAVAEHISGSVEKFSSLMNETAFKIGATNSNFTNPHGLSDSQHFTTAHDLAKITAYALQNPKFREIVSTRTKSIPWKDHDYNRHLVNHNKFLQMYEGCIGVKTGFTKATGRCLVTAVEKNGMRLVCVTLNAPDDWNDHTEMYNNAFAEYSPRIVRQAGEVLGVCEVKDGCTNQVGLALEKEIVIPAKKDENPQIVTEVVPFEDLRAPIKKGNILGSAKLTINNLPCKTYPLVATEDIPLKNIVFKGKSKKFADTFKKVFIAWLTCFN